MKVIIDGMPLGAGHQSASGRTGIYRVVDHLVQGLVRSENCDLNLITTNFHTGLQAYCKEHQDLRLQVAYPTTLDRVIEKVRRRADLFNIVGPIVPDTNLDKLLRNSDVYHSPYSPLPTVVQNSKIKKFLTVHDLIPITHPEYFSESGVPFVEVAINSMKYDGTFFCVSHATKNDLCSHFRIDPARVLVTHLAASPTLFRKIQTPDIIDFTRIKYNIGQCPYYLSLCTFEPRKNIILAIRSFIALIEQECLSDVKLVLIGTMGWGFKDIFDELGLMDHVKSSRIIMPGFVDDKDLAALYSGALAFLYPSFYEGFGLPPLEAMQCGLPVITSNTSSLPEVVGDAGLQIDPRNADELSHSMLKLYKDENLRANLSRLALERSKIFSWEKFTEDTITAYSNAVHQ